MLLSCVLLLTFAFARATLPPSCDSQVYCTGPLLHTVQMARIFNDSKTFVDMKIRNSEQIALENYNAMMNATNNAPTQDQIKQFVSENFDAGNELEDWSPPDFVAEPKFLKNVRDTDLRAFGKDVVALWTFLARKVKPEVSTNPRQYSLMPLPNGFIIPGGRFKEIYYWDTYWIIRGLLISEMHSTARGMIENLMFLVKRLGHVPNGSRVYYTERSQPPLLTKMVFQYMSYTNDTDWLKQNIDVLDNELDYWIKHRQVQVQDKLGVTHKLYQYNAPSYGPRPESYREDFETASATSNPNQTYVELKSGAESGWDFSSRWIFDAEGGSNANLTNIHTRRLVPVDVNAFIYDAYHMLSQLYRSIGNLYKAKQWERQAIAVQTAITSVLWNEQAGVWQDFDLKLKKHRDFFYVSNVAPLWVNMGDVTSNKRTVQKIMKYLIKEGIENFPGGTPSSLVHSGEQWDMPNAWPPLQAIIVQGLHAADDEAANKLAEDLASAWVRANHIGYQTTKEMFEKYDAIVPGQFGGGGEYTVQEGFGWTNGVLLEFLEMFGDILKLE
ncbi:Trehalase [Carabus blaptoides fortunei]